MRNYTLETTVRKDGVINIKAKGRKVLGIKPGTGITVTVKDGTAIIRPKAYCCTLCEKEGDKPLNDFGICQECEKIAIDAILNGKCRTFGDALTIASNMRNKAQRGRKI